MKNRQESVMARGFCIFAVWVNINDKIERPCKYEQITIHGLKINVYTRHAHAYVKAAWSVMSD